LIDAPALPLPTIDQALPDPLDPVHRPFCDVLGERPSVADQLRLRCELPLEILIAKKGVELYINTFRNA